MSIKNRSVEHYNNMKRILVQAVETDIAEISKRVNELAGIKESDTGKPYGNRRHFTGVGVGLVS